VVDPAPEIWPAERKRVHSQSKWPPALKHALTRARELGTRWTWVMDDDTFVVPANLMRVLNRYDATPPARVLVGQRCSEFQRFRAMCGGAGWAMSVTLHAQLVDALPKCERIYGQGSRARQADGTLANSDRFLSRCLMTNLDASLVDAKEFNSQAPRFYETSTGRKDRPVGYGRPATFHYVKSPDEWLSLHHLINDAAPWHQPDSPLGKALGCFQQGFQRGC